MTKILCFVPNILSFFRFCLACFFPFVPEKLWIWVILCGGASDFLDGWIARRWNLTSWQGGIIDAIADKLFVLAALVTFVLAGRFSGWLVPLVIARDLTVALIACYAVYSCAWDSFREMDARWSGKVATAGQFLFMIVVALFPQFIGLVLFIVALISFIAALDYAKEFNKALLLRSKNKSVVVQK
jgi:phosphatidylglycerophosphate synthase